MVTFLPITQVAQSWLHLIVLCSQAVHVLLQELFWVDYFISHTSHVKQDFLDIKDVILAKFPRYIQVILVIIFFFEILKYVMI